MIIQIRIKHVYGRPLMYVVSEHAIAIKALTGRETIDGKDKIALESLGFTFQTVL